MAIKLDAVPDEILMSEVEKRGMDVLVNKVLTKLTGSDNYERSYKQVLKIFIFCVFLFMTFIGVGSYFMISTIHEMKQTYIHETDKIILMNNKIDYAAAWERLGPIEKKERLRSQYYTVIKYYTHEQNISLTDEQILDSFNSLWLMSEKIGTINFFLPLAYIKTTSNFDPNYSNKSKEGYAALFMIDYERFSAMSTDPVSKIIYKGIETARNPSDSIKLLYLKMDYLYRIFNGRTDWILFSLLNNEFEVIQKYWNNGQGEIPDEFYLKGDLYDALNFYHSFINWQIPTK